MNPKIHIRKIWSDNEAIELRIEVFDGVSSFSNTVYIGQQKLEKTVEELNNFKNQVHGGIYDIIFGAFGPEYANGGFQVRLHFHNTAKLYISTYQQSDYVEFSKNKVASEARLYLKSEPALLDRFIGELRSLSVNSLEESCLECL